MCKQIIEKVTLQFSNEIRTLEGEDAQKWYDISNNVVAIACVHDESILELDWKIKERKYRDKTRARKTIKNIKKS